MEKAKVRYKSIPVSPVDTRSKVYLTVGIPASGKSTWAKQMVRDADKKTIIVERDQLRALYHTESGDINDYKFSKNKETLITERQRATIFSAITNGYDVIISDTNLNQEYIKKIINYVCFDLKTEMEYVIFDTPLADCLKRNQKRSKPVPERVIIEMEQRKRKFDDNYFRSPIALARDKATLRPVVICDIDGTIADMTGVRTAYEWDKVDKDRVRHEVVAAANAVVAVRDVGQRLAPRMILFSGRDEVCREATEKWLETSGLTYDELYMRPEGSQEPDTVVKERMFNDVIKDKYYVRAIFDDRKVVCCMWESMGLPVFNVGGFLADF